MSGVEAEGYTKVVHKKYNKAFDEFEDERISNANVRFSEKVTGAYGAVAGQDVTTITVPAGLQLRLIYLNFWCKDPDEYAQLVIEQTGGTSHGLPDGQVDAIMASKGVPYTKLGTLENPVHILEGTVKFTIQNPKEGAEYGLSIWGDQNRSQIV